MAERLVPRLLLILADVHLALTDPPALLQAPLWIVLFYPHSDLTESLNFLSAKS